MLRLKAIFFMKFYLLIYIFLLSNFSVSAQKSIDEALQKYNKQDVPYLKVEKAYDAKGFLFLDARKKEEFDVSHIENAIWVGTNKLNLEEMSILVSDKNAAIIVYCSIGVRSENTAEQFIKSGYTNVYNLYGGIFEWVNQDHPVFNNLGNETNKVHAFSKHWGQFLTKGEKVY